MVGWIIELSLFSHVLHVFPVLYTSILVNFLRKRNHKRESNPGQGQPVTKTAAAAVVVQVTKAYVARIIRASRIALGGVAGEWREGKWSRKKVIQNKLRFAPSVKYEKSHTACYFIIGLNMNLLLLRIGVISRRPRNKTDRCMMTAAAVASKASRLCCCYSYRSCDEN